jgi:hypothetical protein
MTISPLWTIDDERCAVCGAELFHSWCNSCEDAHHITADDEPGADVCTRDEFWGGYEDWRLKDDSDGMDN